MHNQLDRKTVANCVALACAGVLALTPLCTELDGAARWNVWLTAYGVATVAIAALTAEADWTARAEVALGAWLLASPWLFGMGTHDVPALVHAITGLMLCVCGAAELRADRGDPPLLDRPGGASRPLVLRRTLADSRRRAGAVAAHGTRRSRRPSRQSPHRTTSVSPERA